MAPIPSSRPITTSRGRCGRACRWSRSSPAPSRSAPAAPAAAKGRSPRSAPASVRCWPSSCGCGAAERRILLAAGMGAGIAAIFRAPLAGALFASEVLYRSPEFEPEVIMPAAIASVVSYSTFGIFFGWEAAVRHARRWSSTTPGSSCPTRCWRLCHGSAGDDLHAHLLRLTAYLFQRLPICRAISDRPWAPA